MKILLLAGEESGIIYADEIKRRLNKAHEIRGFDDYGFQTHDMAVLGVWPVLRKLPYFLKLKRTMESAIRVWRPDVVVTIDYPGLNLRLAAYAKSLGIRTVHVVCPQVWAWHQERIPKVEATFDKLCCFLPFEPKLFRPGFAEFVGHPLIKVIASTMPAPRTSVKTIAILPGSRKGEIEKILPVLIDTARILKSKIGESIRLVIPAANERAYAQIKAELKSAPDLDFELTLGGARELLLSADCAAVASGTATLEAALAKCPTVLVYKVSIFFELMLRFFVRGTKYAGLANVVWSRSGGKGKEPMPELLQEDFTAATTSRYLYAFLTNAQVRQDVKKRLTSAVNLLSTSTDPLKKICDIIEKI